ncbi:MAG: DNA polymerase ligase N-terminal domain-containing protein [Planctomycetota bacterium]
MPDEFVILRHAEPSGAHYDLMLREGDVLATWRLDANPAEMIIGEIARATTLPAHRLAYLDYEGPISGDRGSVERVDRGRYEGRSGEGGGYAVALIGDVIRGTFELTGVGGHVNRWRLVRLR